MCLPLQLVFPDCRCRCCVRELPLYVGVVNPVNTMVIIGLG